MVLVGTRLTLRVVNRCSFSANVLVARKLRDVRALFGRRQSHTLLLNTLSLHNHLPNPNPPQLPRP